MEVDPEKDAAPVEVACEHDFEDGTFAFAYAA